jgi:hypothetical protein
VLSALSSALHSAIACPLLLECLQAGRLPASAGTHGIGLTTISGIASRVTPRSIENALGSIAMGTVAALRAKQYRQRKRYGLACFEIELPEVETIEALQRTGFLSSDTEAHDDVCDALQRAVLLLIEG